MAEYIAGRGTTALGTVGTILGSIGTAGVLGLGSGLFNGGNSAMQTEINDIKEMDNLKSQLAQEKAERYADKVGLEVYQYVESQLKSIRADENDKWTAQAVVNANVNSGLNVLNSQVADVTATVNSITKTAVPTSAICNFGCGCNTTNI